MLLFSFFFSILIICQDISIIYHTSKWKRLSSILICQIMDRYWGKDEFAWLMIKWFNVCEASNHFRINLASLSPKRLKLAYQYVKSANDLNLILYPFHAILWKTGILY